MRKLTALFLALSLMILSSVSVFAADKEINIEKNSGSIFKMVLIDPPVHD